MDKEKWVVGNTPPKKGWYAALCCWEVQEGIIPMSMFWDGDNWDNERPIISYFGPFENKELAYKWAYANDIEEV